MSHMEHGVGCPSVSGGITICDDVLAHLEQWQSALAATLAELLLLCALVFILFRRSDFETGGFQYERSRSLERVPIRPTLFQELFAQGILNRKEL